MQFKVKAASLTIALLSMANNASADWAYTYVNTFTVKPIISIFPWEFDQTPYDFTLQAHILLENRIEANKTYNWYDITGSSINNGDNTPVISLPPAWNVEELFNAPPTITTDGTGSIVSWYIHNFAAGGSATTETTNGRDYASFNYKITFDEGETFSNGSWTETYVANPLYYNNLQPEDLPGWGSPIPEADSYAFMLVGLGLMGFMRRRIYH